MSQFEDVFQQLFFKRFKEVLNLGKVESFGHLADWCESDTGLTKNHLPSNFFTDLHQRYLNITEGSWLTNLLTLDLEEIIVHQNDRIEVVRSNAKEMHSTDLSEQDYYLFLETTAIKYSVEWNHNCPFASFYGEINNKAVRFTLVHQSLSAILRPKLFIRFISTQNISHHSFLKESESLDISSLITTKKNILICGSTGSGKTTFLSALVGLIPKEEHVMIMEDTREIKSEHINWTRLLADEKNKGKSMVDLCSYAMRMRPDRLILGEMRSTEVVSFLLTLNSGHRGCLSTIHASSSVDALYRLSLLFELYSSKGSMSEKRVMELVCRNVDYVFYLENKKIKEIIKVIGFDGERPFYEEISCG